MTRRFYYAPSTHGFYISGIFLGVMPEDAREITEARHTELFEGQSQGKLISKDADGNPILVDYPPPTAEDHRLYRNVLLRDSDWTQAADIPDTIKGAWATYRQALRDVPQQSGFPDNIEWPVPPN